MLCSLESVKLMATSRAALAVVVAASLVAAFLVYRYLIALGGTLGWDESAHALYGLLIAHDLSQHDWISLLYDTYRQVYWPPLYSWLAGLLFLFTGASDVAARSVSAICLAALPPLLFLAARRMSPEHGTTAGLLTASLALTSPALIRYSSVSMLEMPGLVAVAFTLYAWIEATTSPDARRWHVLAGLGVVAAFFAKTNYGIILGLALVVAELTGARTGMRTLFSRRYVWTFLPVLVALGLWFAYPAKLRETWEGLVNQTWGVKETYGVTGLLFYPRAFVDLSGSGWLSAAYLVCLLAALLRWRDPRIRLLGALVAIQFLIGELHHTKLPRHLLPIYPALFVLAGHFGAACWHALKVSRGAALRWGVRGAILALIFYSGNLALRTQPPRGPEIDRAIARELGPILRPARALAVISWDYPCPLCLDWFLITRESALEPGQAASVAQTEQTYRLRGLVSRQSGLGLVRDTLLPALARYGTPGKSMTYYSSGGTPSALLKHLIGTGDFDRLAILSVVSDSSDLTPTALEPLLRMSAFKQDSRSLVRSQTGSLSEGTVILRLDTYRK
jgi:4-amino-4-deoxy-L-arabinose transferase-like glycosyltransferase